MDPSAQRPSGEPPTPARPWALRMRWSELAFLHWPVRAEPLERLLPPGLELERFEGEAWLGIVPFRMSEVRLRGVPPVPTAHDFPELNLRTYVRQEVRRGAPLGPRRGVWFFSLDAASRLAVLGGRLGFHLPYFHARMRCTQREGRVDYASVRRTQPGPSFAARYRPAGPVQRPRPDTLEHFLVERYALFAWNARRRRLLVGSIRHEPWPLQPCELELEHTTLERPLGLVLPTRPALAHYAESLDVRAWSPERA